MNRITTLSPQVREKLKGLGLSKTQILVCEKAIIFGNIEEMAASLFICRCSVMWHLTIIYKKLGWSGRSPTKLRKLIIYVAKLHKV